jgi:hypothetical protein
MNPRRAPNVQVLSRKMWVMVLAGLLWWALQGSNLRPSPCKCETNLQVNGLSRTHGVDPNTCEYLGVPVSCYAGVTRPEPFDALEAREHSAMRGSRRGTPSAPPSRQTILTASSVNCFEMLREIADVAFDRGHTIRVAPRPPAPGSCSGDRPLANRPDQSHA